MEQPEGFIKPGLEDHIWELHHGLYSMKQGRHIWNKTLHLQLVAWCFTRLECEYCMYYRHDATSIIALAIHVNDFFMLGNSKHALLVFKEQLQTCWKISNGGPAHFHIGIAIECDHLKQTIGLSQTALINHIIEQFSLGDTLPVTMQMEPSCQLSKAMSV